MSIESIKLNLLEWLVQIEDKNILTKLKKFRDEIELTQREKKSKKEMSTPVLSKNQIQRIEESKTQIRNGKFLSNKDADKIVSKWLRE